MGGSRQLIGALAAAALLWGCGGGGGGGSSEPVPSGHPAAPLPTFNDVTSTWNVNFVLGYSGFDPDLSGFAHDAAERVYKTHPSGAAAGDCDGDGDIDLFVTSGDAAPNRLYVNQGGFTFMDNTAARNPELAYAKSATAGENYQLGGAAFADLDGDDDIDLVVGGIFGDPTVVFENGGNCNFTNVTAGSGIDTLDVPFNISVAFGDYDRDGYVDLFLSHWGTQVPDRLNPGDTKHLWRNAYAEKGRIAFESVSVQTGLAPSILAAPDPRIRDERGDFTFTPTFARINDDLWPDILSVGDFNYSQIFINTAGAGSTRIFDDVTDFDVVVDDNGMGSAVGDYDNDGDLDWFVTSIYTRPLVPTADPLRVGNRLYRNDGQTVPGYFTDVTDAEHVWDGGWGWGACMLDIDNDGDLDIYHTNGWPKDAESDSLGIDYSADRSRLFVSDGPPNYDFEERAAEFGLDDTEEGRGVVCADFDNDGDVDILQMHNSPVVSGTLWENDSTRSNNFLRVKLRGLAPNTEAAGARIWATINGVTQMREIMLGSNFTSQNPPLQVIGLGSSAIVDELKVEWPDGRISVMANVPADQTLTLYHPDRADNPEH